MTPRLELRSLARDRISHGATTISVVVFLTIVALAGSSTQGFASPPSPEPNRVRATSPNGPSFPATGAWFGAFVSNVYGGTPIPHPEAVATFESDIGRKLALDRRYFGWQEKFPNADDRVSRDQGHTQWLTWTPNVRWDTIAAGDWDATIDARATDLRDFGAPVFLTFHQEPERFDYLGTPEDFIAAYRHVHDRLVAKGATNVGFALTMGWYAYNPESSHYADDFYPGDGYVDVLTAEVYNWNNCEPWIPEWTSFRDIASDFYDYGMAKNKPMMVADYGSVEDQGSPGRKAQWITDAATTVKQWPMIKGVAYFDSNDGICDWGVETSISAMNAFSQMGEDPYFNPPPPLVTFSAVPPELSKSRTATFEFAANYGPVTFTCALDSGAASPCTSPKTYTGLADGGHTLTVQAKDSVDFTSTSYAIWAIDATPPLINVYEHPNGFTNVPTATFAWNASEWPMTYTCGLDGAPPVGCEAGVTYGPLPDGTHTFRLTGTDEAGNVTAPPTFRWTVDTAAPTLTVTGGPPPITNLKSASWTFSSSEPANYRCQKDANAFYRCNTPFTWTGMPEGPHSLSVYSTDRAGNTSATWTQSWTVDATRPTAKVTSPSNGAQVSGTVTVSVSATDNFGVTKVELYVDGVLSGTDTTSPFSFNWNSNSVSNGTHSIYAKSYDAAGNSKASSTISVTVAN